MNRLLIAVAATVFLLSGGLASAGEASGKIKSIHGNTMTLDNGAKFTLGTGTSMKELKPGTEVTVSFEEKAGRKMATEVKPKAK